MPRMPETIPGLDSAVNVVEHADHAQGPPRWKLTRQHGSDRVHVIIEYDRPARTFRVTRYPEGYYRNEVVALRALKWGIHLLTGASPVKPPPDTQALAAMRDAMRAVAAEPANAAGNVMAAV